MSVPPIALGQAPFAGVMLRLALEAGGPPWRLELWNHQTQVWESVGQPARGVLYEYGPGGLEFVLTAEGNVIGVAE